MTMRRDTAIALCREKCLKETTVRHLISVEGVMRSLAERFGEDEDAWALTGLFHDLDQDHTGDDAANHAHLAAGWLREAGVDEAVVNGVLAHAEAQSRQHEFFLATRARTIAGRPDDAWTEIARHEVPKSQKDLHAALELAARLGVELPAAAVAHDEMPQVWGASS